MSKGTISDTTATSYREWVKARVEQSQDENALLRDRIRQLETLARLRYMAGQEDGRAEGVAVERKRCAEVARSVADEMDGRETRATWVGKAIAAAIERGDK